MLIVRGNTWTFEVDREAWAYRVARGNVWTFSVQVGGSDALFLTEEDSDNKIQEEDSDNLILA